MAKPDGDFRRAYEKGFGRLKISIRRQQIEADKRELVQEATVTEKVAPLSLSPEDEAFLKRKAAIVGTSASD